MLWLYQLEKEFAARGAVKVQTKFEELSGGEMFDLWNAWEPQQTHQASPPDAELLRGSGEALALSIPNQSCLLGPHFGGAYKVHRWIFSFAILRSSAAREDIYVAGFLSSVGAVQILPLKSSHCPPSVTYSAARWSYLIEVPRFLDSHLCSVFTKWRILWSVWTAA